MSFLEINNLKKSFGKTEVLKDVSFSLEKGEVVAIIGASGSGKTTLLRCLCGLERIDGGAFALDKLYSKNQIEAARKDNGPLFGMVFQEFNLFPHMTAAENVELAPNLLAKKQKKCDYINIRKANRKKAENLLISVGLGDKLESYPCFLSGGQKQRVALARALALEPEVLCFDEPTSALDPALKGEVSALIRSLKKDGHRTIAVVTHEMGFARSVADKIVFLCDGAVEEQGIPEDIFTKPQSSKLSAFIAAASEECYGTQQREYRGNDCRAL